MPWPYTITQTSAPHRGLKLITPPATEPFSVADAKLHCRIDGLDDDLNVMKWIRAARAKVEKDTGRALLAQTWDLFLDAFYPPGLSVVSDFGWPYGAPRSIGIPNPPLQSVTGVYQTDTAGAETVWAASNYIVDTASEPGRIGLSDTGSWPSGTRVFQPGRIRFVAGYASVADIPSDLMQAMALLLGTFSEHREPLALRRGEMESTLYDDLVAPYMLWQAA